MSTSSATKPEWLEYVQKISREQTLRCLQSFPLVQEAKVEVDTDNQVVPAHWMGAIVNQGAGFRMILKVYSNSEGLDQLIASALRVSTSDLRGYQFSDFLRELCNLASGMIKSDLSRAGLEMANSLPISTRGVDSVFFQSSAGSSSYSDRWIVSWSRGRVFFEATIDVLNQADLGSFDIKKAEAPEVDLFEELLN